MKKKLKCFIGGNGVGKKFVLLKIPCSEYLKYIELGFTDINVLQSGADYKIVSMPKSTYEKGKRFTNGNCEIK